MGNEAILISGASGYLGCHLVNALTERNIKVITATRDGSGDISMDFSKLDKVNHMNVEGIDTMIHMVTPNEARYKSEADVALSENAAAIYAALQFCYRNNISNFIYFSSFHVFGKQEGRLVESTPVNPVSVYGLAHATAEQTVNMFNQNGKVNTWIVRPSNVFGVPVQDRAFKRWNLIPFAFCKEAVEKNTITLGTPGNQLRNFVSTGDVCRKVIDILERKPNSRVIHAYGKETISVLDFAKQVQKVAQQSFGWPVQIIRPDGNELGKKFAFTSEQENSQRVTPRDTIEDFLKEMMMVLLRDSKR